MPGTYSQMYIHIVFAVKGRQRLINPSWEENLYRYITGIVTNKGQKMLAVNGMSDHIHILIGMKPSCCLSDLVREIKKSSNEFIKESGFTNTNFNWQEGFGAFTCGHSQLDTVIAYIHRQKEHHRIKPYDEEFREFLVSNQIDYQEKYLIETNKFN